MAKGGDKKPAKGGKGKDDSEGQGKGGGKGLKAAKSINVRHILVRLFFFFFFFDPAINITAYQLPVRETLEKRRSAGKVTQRGQIR